MPQFSIASRGLICLAIFSQILGIVSVILIATWITKYMGGFSFAKQEFNFHPFFMILGLNFMYGEALLTFRLFPNTKKLTVKLLHAGLHIGAIVFAIVGLYAIFDTHNKHHIKHLYTIHSWMGLGTIICFIIQFLAGLLSFLIPAVPMSIRTRVMPYHRFAGMAIYVMALVTISMGIMETARNHISNYAELPGQAWICNCLVLFMVINAAIILWILSRDEYRRRATSEEVLHLVESK